MPSEQRPPLPLISPAGTLIPGKLMGAAIKLAASLPGLVVPNVNGELLLLKACTELRMPEVRMEFRRRVGDARTRFQFFGS